MEYPVHETFHSWQGEGDHSGKSAFFVRLYGCPVHCPWCDSAGTWHPDYVPEKVDRIDAAMIADAARQHPGVDAFDARHFVLRQIIMQLDAGAEVAGAVASFADD